MATLVRNMRLRRPKTLSCSVVRTNIRLFTRPAFKSESDVRIVEAGARDGLQNIKQSIPTKTKIELLERLASSGLHHIEATSFVSPKWIPQLADAAEVMKRISPLIENGEINFPVLVPNLKGLENAVKSNAKEIGVGVSATEAFSKANMNCTVDECLVRSEEIAKAATENGIAIRGLVSSSDRPRLKG